MTTLKQKMEASCAFGVTPADMRKLLSLHVIDNPIVYGANNAKNALCLSDLDHMTMLAFHAVLALEEAQAALLDATVNAGKFEEQRARIEESMRDGARLTKHRFKLEDGQAQQPDNTVANALGAQRADRYASQSDMRAAARARVSDSKRGRR